jgi:hypothetical protein
MPLIRDLRDFYFDQLSVIEQISLVIEKLSTGEHEGDRSKGISEIFQIISPTGKRVVHETGLARPTNAAVSVARRRSGAALETAPSASARRL